METKFGRKLHNFYGPDLKEVGKTSMEWDLNDWKWDGDLFVAAPLNSDCRSRQIFPVSANNDEVLQIERENRDLEKRRRVENEELNLQLGRQDDGKKTKLLTAPSNRAVCQVQDCKADLSNAKDYHRRHKVCDVHSKATSCFVGNVMQRFCQQCSRSLFYLTNNIYLLHSILLVFNFSCRFHVLQEFDEGKRSCRRRLAGHNKRRRKTHPENVVNTDDRGSNYLLITLLRILSDMHCKPTFDCFLSLFL